MNALALLKTLNKMQLIPIVVTALCFIAVCLAVVNNVNRIGDKLSTIHNHALPEAMLTSDLIRAIEQTYMLLEDYQKTPNPIRNEKVQLRFLQIEWLIDEIQNYTTPGSLIDKNLQEMSITAKKLESLYLEKIIPTKIQKFELLEAHIQQTSHHLLALSQTQSSVTPSNETIAIVAQLYHLDTALIQHLSNPTSRDASGVNKHLSALNSQMLCNTKNTALWFCSAQWQQQLIHYRQTIETLLSVDNALSSELSPHAKSLETKLLNAVLEISRQSNHGIQQTTHAAMTKFKAESAKKLLLSLFALMFGLVVAIILGKHLRDRIELEAG